MDSKGFYLISKDSEGLYRILEDSVGKDSEGLILTDSYGLFNVLMDSNEFSWIVMTSSFLIDFEGSKGILNYSERF